ncbi:hypothetical protein [Acidocella aminolytica]|uniref:Uncharacterized protein n=1 Tax=Acidocella aminolytica 101 = DSM 11237 TaxID=1120923 RepID=A0A0D6PDR5_9PROT|nr:hypothetical protein [Acidocella aminolytica]GAN79496.1 hypothetical protein Aam_021_084 [Acidocella aminolytica 101 = DSM 11237]GBQ44340.1 hypothetical protein AA11237_3511 [Acidocella aminolytica 101 = DSM 11237]SHE47270.1 hypothetical protein SAMN02746095_00582 [Acidocella aminolytica 101 = DSM 11237]
MPEGTGFAITTTELDIDSGECVLELTWHPDPAGGEQDVLLLIEQIGEQPVAGLVLSLEYVFLGTNQSEVQSIQTYIGVLAGEINRLGIRFIANTRKRLRVTLLRIFKSTIEYIECSQCKKLVKALLVAGLSAIGVHFLGGVVVLSGTLKARLAGWLSHGYPANLLANHGFILRIMNYLGNGLGQLNTALHLTDQMAERLFTEVCRGVGLCST